MKLRLIAKFVSSECKNAGHALTVYKATSSYASDLALHTIPQHHHSQTFQKQYWSSLELKHSTGAMLPDVKAQYFPFRSLSLHFRMHICYFT